MSRLRRLTSSRAMSSWRWCRKTAAGGATLIVASHDPALALRFDRVLDLRHGDLHCATVVSPVEGVE